MAPNAAVRDAVAAVQKHVSVVHRALVSPSAGSGRVHSRGGDVPETDPCRAKSAEAVDRSGATLRRFATGATAAGQ